MRNWSATHSLDQSECQKSGFVIPLGRHACSADRTTSIGVRLSIAREVEQALSSCRGHCESETQYAQSRSCSVGAGRLSPVGKSPIPKKTMMDCFEMVPANSEQILNLTVDSKESLSLLHRLEPSHLPLLFPGMLMRDFSPVVLILTRSMLD